MELDHEHAVRHSDVLLVRQIVPFIRRSEFQRIRRRKDATAAAAASVGRRRRNSVLVGGELDEPLTLSVVEVLQNGPEKLEMKELPYHSIAVA